MNRFRNGLLTAGALALMLAAPAGLAAQSNAAWIHVQVAEGGDKAETVNVNLPLSLARVALQVAPKKMTEELHEKMSESEMSLADLRLLWAELKNAGDAEFVTVESGDESVRVARVGDKIRVFVEELKEDEGAESAERVQVEIPVEVVDALLSGEGEELNLEAAVARLADQRGDIVKVEDGESRVRVWIDEKG